MVAVALLLVGLPVPNKVKGDDRGKKGKPDPPGWGWDMWLAIPTHKNVLLRRY